MHSASTSDVNVDPLIAEDIHAESGLEPLGHKWSDDECKILWLFVEDLQEELYHGKGNLMKPQVIAKITNMMSEYKMLDPPKEGL